MIDAASEVSSADLLPGHCPRIAPYIYADAEIAALLAAAGQLRPPLRAARHQMLIGLLAVTGMRPGEALALDRQDADLRHGVLHIHAGKQKKQREVPLHHSTVSALREYARLRDARFPTPSTPCVLHRRPRTADGLRRTEPDIHQADPPGRPGRPRRPRQAPPA